jgi:hypothetical protein
LNLAVNKNDSFIQSFINEMVKVKNWNNNFIISYYLKIDICYFCKIWSNFVNFRILFRFIPIYYYEIIKNIILKYIYEK